MHYSETYFNINTYSHGGSVLSVDRSKDTQERIYGLEDFIADTFLTIISTILELTTKAKLNPISVRLSLEQLLNILQLTENDFMPIIKPIYERGIDECESKDEFDPKITQLSSLAADKIFELVADRIKPGIFEPKSKPAKIIASRLFNQGNLEPTPSCAIVDTVYSFCVGRNLTLSRVEADLVGKKQFSNGSVELVLEKIKKETEEAIINAYGVDTLDIFYVLIAYSFKNQLSYNQSITVSGWDILDYINRRNKRNSTGEKRLTKKQGLEWVAHHCKLLGVMTRKLP